MKALFWSGLILLTAACSASPDGDATKTAQQAAPRASTAAPPPSSAAAPSRATARPPASTQTAATTSLAADSSSVSPPIARPSPALPQADGSTATRAIRLSDAVRRACDLVAQIAARAKGVTIKRTTGPFEDEFESRTRSGCSISLVGSNAALGASPIPIELWRQQFAARGWQEDVNHSADGPDGTRFAFVRDGVICMFQGQWDGGDDTDPSVKPDDAYTGAGHCAVNDAC